MDLGDFSAFSLAFTSSGAFSDDYLYAEAAAGNATELGNVYNFTGRRLDRFDNDGTVRQLYHYRARAYDPLHGRILQRDYLGIRLLLFWDDLEMDGPSFDGRYFADGIYADGLNIYRYGRYNPLNFTDPYGLDSRFGDWMDCMGLCIDDNDILDLAYARFLAGLTMPIKKTWIAKYYQIVGDERRARAILRTLKVEGTSKFSMIPAALSHPLKLVKPRAFFKKAGPVAGPITVAYGLSLLAVDTHCLGWCCGTRKYDRVQGNITNHLLAEYAQNATDKVIRSMSGK